MDRRLSLLAIALVAVTAACSSALVRACWSSSFRSAGACSDHSAYIAAYSSWIEAFLASA